MNLEDIKAKAAALLSESDAGVISSTLAAIVDECTIAEAERIQLQTQLDAAYQENSNLRQTNMDLFLKIPVSQQTEQAEPEEEEKPSFDKLFENGKLI